MTRTVPVLLVLTLVAGAAAVWAVRARGVEVSAADVGGAFAPGLAERVNDVSTLIVTGADGRVVVGRRDGVWRVEAKDGYPAQLETVKRVVVGAAGLERIAAKTSNPDQYHKLGVGEPGQEGAVGLELRDAAGETLLSLIVGRGSSSAPGQLYVRAADEAQSWLVSGDLAPSPAALTWIDRQVLAFESDRVQEVRIVHSDGEEVAIVRPELDEAAWEIEGLGEDEEPATPSTTRTLAGALEWLTVDDVAAAADVPADGRVTATFRAVDGLVITVDTAPEGEDRMLARFVAAASETSEPAVQQEAAALTRTLSDWVFELPSYKADVLRQRREDLVMPVVEEEDEP